MAKASIEGRSLVGASQQEVRTWVSDYIVLSGLNVSVDQLIAAALHVEGTHQGVTKTKVRKARRIPVGKSQNA